MPLVINSLGDGHTQTRTHTDVRTKSILRNQVRASHRPGLKIIITHHITYTAKLHSSEMDLDGNI